MIPEQLDRNGKRLPWQTCPVCGYRFDCASAVDGSDHRAHPGDISLCLKCGEVLEFQKDMTIQPASIASLMELSNKQSYYLAQAQRQIRKRRVKG